MTILAEVYDSRHVARAEVPPLAVWLVLACPVLRGETGTARLGPPASPRPATRPDRKRTVGPTQPASTSEGKCTPGHTRLQSTPSRNPAQHPHRPSAPAARHQKAQGHRQRGRTHGVPAREAVERGRVQRSPQRWPGPPKHRFCQHVRHHCPAHRRQEKGRAQPLAQGP